MFNFKFFRTIIFVGVLVIQPLLNSGSMAWARKKTPPKAFSFIAEGGKASQGECDGERKIPRKLKHLKEYAKSNSYMGSELQTPEIQGKNNEEMWKHFFRIKASCNSVLAKTPSSVESSKKDNKAELPPDDSTDEEDDKPNEGPDAE